jgi:hypothetical protein
MALTTGDYANIQRMIDASSQWAFDKAAPQMDQWIAEDVGKLRSELKAAGVLPTPKRIDVSPKG